MGISDVMIGAFLALFERGLVGGAGVTPDDEVVVVSGDDVGSPVAVPVGEQVGVDGAQPSDTT